MMTQLTDHRALRQQDAVRAGGRRDARPRCRPGRLGRRRRARSPRRPSTHLPDGHRPLRPPARRARDQHGGQVFRCRRQPRHGRRWLRPFVKMFVDWNQDGTMAKDVWAGQGGAAYQDAAQEFINGQPGLLLLRAAGRSAASTRRSATRSTGRWWVRPAARRLHRHAGRCRPGRLQADQAPRGSRQGASTSSPSEDVHAELMARTNNVPATRASPRKALDVHGRLAAGSRPRSRPGPTRCRRSRRSRTSCRATPQPRDLQRDAQRVTQAIVGEMTIDEALKRITADVKRRWPSQAVAAVKADGELPPAPG